MATSVQTPNVLLIIADDLGHDVVRITGSGTSRAAEVHTNDGSVDIYGPLANVSRLLRNGLHFEQAWAQPACSPTRASIYTGLHPWKTGVGSPTDNPELEASKGFATLPTLMADNYVSGLFGKWHLGTKPGTRPTDHGWDKFVGTLGGELPDNGTESYRDWTIVDSDTNYTATPVDDDYATRRTVQEAAAWVNALDPETPWFVTVAFHSPHSPFHIPPGGYDINTAGDKTSDDYKYNLMAQNMDSGIGRLLGTFGHAGGGFYFDPIPEDQLSNAIIIFIGDNGSPSGIYLEEGKMEIYEGGVRVPMIIADGQAVMNEINGRAITSRFVAAPLLNTSYSPMAHVIDLHSTIVRLVDPALTVPRPTDSKDFSDVVRIVKKTPEPPKPKPMLPVLYAQFLAVVRRQWHEGHDQKRRVQVELRRSETAEQKILSVPVCQRRGSRSRRRRERPLRRCHQRRRSGRADESQRAAGRAHRPLSTR